MIWHAIGYTCHCGHQKILKWLKTSVFLQPFFMSKIENWNLDWGALAPKMRLKIVTIWLAIVHPYLYNYLNFGKSCILTQSNLIHRDRTKAVPFVFFILFFSSFEHVQSLLIMGPNNTKNSSLKCDFLIINYE